MSPEGRNRIKEVFSEAAELEGPQRAAYLDEACGGDQELRREVEKLLSALDSDEGILGSSSIGGFLFRGISEQLTFSAGACVGGRFRISRLIGVGGMGEVYEADDLQLGGRIALKTLRPPFLNHPGFAARFRREIQLARRVTHPNVCRIFDIGRERAGDRDTIYLTMEFLDGETLADRLKRGPMQPKDALPIIRQIVQGLMALHEAQVIHRDLKPSNVLLVDPEGLQRAVITDFGLAHTVLPGADESVTLAGQILGTPAYAAPEQLAAKNVGPEADFYSLGIMMYEMLCGRRPFEAETIFESAAQKLATAPEPPGRYAPLDHRWDEVILGCLEREPGKRLCSARQLLEALQTIGEMENAGAGPVLVNRPWRSPAVDGRGRATGGRRLRLRPVLWGLAAVTATAIPFQFTGLRRSLDRNLCRQFPGNTFFCELPVEKSIAVFPFKIAGATDSDRALASGLARHVRESFSRLAPDPGKMCVHLRSDQLSEGVSLILEGEIQASGSTVASHFVIRESRAPKGASDRLTLRRVERSWKLQSSPDLYDGALRALARAVEIRYADREWRAWSEMAPKHPETVASYLSGLGLLDMGKYEEAAHKFDEVLDPTRGFTFAPAHVGLGDAYRLLFNKTRDSRWEQRSRAAYQRSAPLDRDFGFGGVERSWGELESGAGRAASAIEHYQSALKLWPYDQTLRKSLVSAYEAHGKPEGAAAVLREGTQIAPKCWLTHNSLASFYSRHGRLIEAEKSMLEVIRLAPDNGGAYGNLAFDYVKMGRFDDAIEMASKSIQVRPYPVTYSTLGRAFLYRGCRADGLINLKKAVDLAPEFYVVWANLADALEATGRGPEASAASQRTLQLCRRVLDKTPEDAYARANYALNLARLGRKRDAVVFARGAAAQKPESDDVVLTSAEALDIAGQRTAALELIEKALRGGHGLPQVQSRHGLVRLRDDPSYRELVKRLRLDPAADPGSLTPPRASGCPEWGVPGNGFRPNSQSSRSDFDVNKQNVQFQRK